MSDYDSIDFFTDPSLVPDPYPYFDYLRSQNPVLRLPHYGVVAVTGYDEATAVYKDTDSFSNCVALGGPFPPLPFVPEGDDINAQIDQSREKFPMYEHMVTMDPPDHTRARSLLNRLLTPSRLKQNEEFMWRLADRQLDEFLGNGRCEFISEYSKPFATLVIADLLGVPEDDHKEFRVMLGAERPGARVGGLDHESVGTNPLQWLDEKFSNYIEDRRREAREDVLTALATAKYPDGSTPEVIDVVRSATFLFAAGQETTAKLLSAALQVLVDRPGIQQRLRHDRSLIPAFIEESLRLESPVKSDSRLARRTTNIAGVDIPAGTVVVVLPGAVNRDPRRFDNPHEFRLDRKNVREHMAFARGVHSCPGAPLARVEGRVSIERILDRMADIAVDPARHGPAGDRRYRYEPTYILRGLTELHLTFTPTG
ncbi:cytochrome P450 family protein [Mycobacterium kansasii 732]|uniref:Cytochrome P450 144 n=1 Tax=Mycobacterium pseudokansasii TaxID=2341080 RepID=A0A498QXG7_9MYCO|nr:cytochrome P450 [Mycobacterium pseudokansasii]EUA07717.1 cytochrome P450 family protein [Mycobacterium kansasii 732]KZS63034.1 cytochrome [Mycobacterium kansasii]MBY0388295.1 cytochrome P450 [Mycobacterium pseudokansasii]VBA30804.1 Cytochrome P450 144 [Mycobacterium pseudokansasii]VBA32644.1 Cytochrome P450 144 [Mycobacterium pseudokansasii]